MAGSFRSDGLGLLSQHRRVPLVSYQARSSPQAGTQEHHRHLVSRFGGSSGASEVFPLGLFATPDHNSLPQVLRLSVFDLASVVGKCPAWPEDRRMILAMPIQQRPGRPCILPYGEERPHYEMAVEQLRRISIGNEKVSHQSMVEDPHFLEWYTRQVRELYSKVIYHF